MRRDSQTTKSKRRLEPTRTFGVAVVFAIAAGLHIYQFAIEWVFLGRAGRLGILTSSFVAVLQLFFVLAFLICLVGLLINRLPGLFLSILGLVGVLAGYAYWFSYSSRALRALKEDVHLQKHPDLMPRHFMGLVGAGWWDIAILIAVLVVLVWQIKLLIGTLRHRDQAM
jgi:hypothetical protein